MIKKTHLALILFLSACQASTSQSLNGFTVKSSEESAVKISTPQVRPSGSPDSSFTIPGPPTASGEPFRTQANEVQVDQKPKFDGVIPTENPNDVIPGSITVIYRNANQFRVDKETKTISSISTADAKEVNHILKPHELIALNDLAYPDITEEQLEQDVRLVSEKFGIEAPDRRSIHTYQFSADVDTKQLAAQLRALSFVRTAYMTPRINLSASVTQLSSHSLTSTLSPPSETAFSSPESGWWWFNRHKVFHGWNYYASTSMPIIAVVDSGFDNRSGSADVPNYLSGLSIKYDPFASPVWELGSDVFEYATDNPQETVSHGSFVASIAASPKDNGAGFAGIAPGASIRPYKLIQYCHTSPCNPSTHPDNYTYHRNAIGHGIFQASYSDADVINVSMHVGWGKPLIADPAINNEILVAAVVQEKLVVITAGNSSVNIDATNEDTLHPNYPFLPNDDTCIVVGGSESDTAIHSKAWSGSNFGYRVDLSAAAHSITASSYNTNTSGTSTLFQGSGTSYAAPMVAATVGMMKKIAETQSNYLTPAQLKDLVIHGATPRRFSAAGSGSDPETAFLGKGLGLTGVNIDSMVGIRDLNVLNALALAKNSSNYQILTRTHNIDDYTWMAFNYDWSTYYQKAFGEDTIYGVSGLSSGDVVNFSTYNVSGSYALGYQVYRNSYVAADLMGGVAYITGVMNNASFPSGWYGGAYYTY